MIRVVWAIYLFVFAGYPTKKKQYEIRSHIIKKLLLLAVSCHIITCPFYNQTMPLLNLQVKAVLLELFKILNSRDSVVDGLEKLRLISL